MSLRSSVDSLEAQRFVSVALAVQGLVLGVAGMSAVSAPQFGLARHVFSTRKDLIEVYAVASFAALLVAWIVLVVLQARGKWPFAEPATGAHLVLAAAIAGAGTGLHAGTLNAVRLGEARIASTIDMLGLEPLAMLTVAFAAGTSRRALLAVVAVVLGFALALELAQVFGNLTPVWQSRTIHVFELAIGLSLVAAGAAHRHIERKRAERSTPS